MFIHCNPLRKDSCILAPQALLYNTWLFPNWPSGRCDLSLGKKSKSGGAESGELGGACSNSKPKYLQVSWLSLADTLLLLKLLFCPFLEFHTPLTAILGLKFSEKRR